MKLNARHTTAKAMPKVARREKMTVRERATDTSFFVGTPSYGIRPPEKWRNGERISVVVQKFHCCNHAHKCAWI